MVGVIGVGSLTQRDFRPWESFLESAAAIVSTGLNNARLYAQVVGHARELEQRVAERTRDLEQAKAFLEESQRLTWTGSWERDLRTGASQWSAELFRLLGLDPETSQPSHTAILERAHPDDVAAMAAFLTDISGGNEERVFRYLGPDGEERWCRIHREVVADEEGRPARLVGTFQDVTAKRQADRELRILRQAVEQSPASIIITDAAGTIQYVNPFFTEVTGYTAQETLGQNPRIFKSGVHDQEHYAELWRTLGEGRTWRGELCNQRKDGSLYWEDASIAPLRDESGRTTHYIAVKADITDRKQAEVDLRLALSEVETIFNSSSVGMAYTRPGLVLSRANERLWQILGYPGEELEGRSLAELLFEEEERDATGPTWLEQLSRGEEVQDERRMLRRDGSGAWCAISGRTVIPASPESGVIWVLEDISERKELEQLREDVERIMRHDLKAPLVGIINLPELLLEDENLTEEQVEYLEMIRESGRNMLNQVNLSLDLYKMETGSYQYQPQPVDLVRLAGQIERDLGGQAHSLGVRLEVSVRGQPISQASPFIVQAESLLLYSMLANLVSNALEATPMGGAVSMAVTETGEGARFAVHNPAAVPEAVRDVFFEKYATHGKKRGTGLGTYSAKLMAETMGGDIGVSTSDATGTIVSVNLPFV
jgi:PAS domain S-box-containing protein